MERVRLSPGTSDSDDHLVDCSGATIALFLQRAEFRELPAEVHLRMGNLVLNPAGQIQIIVCGLERLMIRYC